MPVVMIVVMPMIVVMTRFFLVIVLIRVGRPLDLERRGDLDNVFSIAVRRQE